MPVRGAILTPDDLDGTAGCFFAVEAWDAVPCPLEMKIWMSSLVTRPLFPVPGTRLMSMPDFFARCLTAGVDNALELLLSLL